MRMKAAIPFIVAVVFSLPAWAHPSMVRHNYGSCASCHVDPSGAGQLTQYGRAQADVLVRWKVKKASKEDEVSPLANFLWFLELPEALNVSGNLRSGALVRPSASPPVLPLFMSYDAYATVNLSWFVAHATAGLGVRNAQLAAVAPQCDPAATGSCGLQFVSRQHWLGAKFSDETVMLRAGRMNLPFGLRNHEHNSFIRTMTRTDVNLAQQVGASAAFNSETIRGEVMGIAGNFQLGPDLYRERGYSAFGEYSLSASAYLGLSSLITGAGADITTGLPTTRQAHGFFARWAPVDTLAVLLEADFLVWQVPQKVDRLGFATFLQGDFELIQGLHVLGTIETAHSGSGERGPSLGIWGSIVWNFFPHMEFRIDNIVRRMSQPGSDASFTYSLLAQIHLFL
jgi:hypothetical protein